MKTFRDKVVVVTGAGSGIGRATARLFSGLGADLVAADVRAERLDSLAAEIEGRGGKVRTYVLDVSDREAVNGFAGAVLSERGRVDVLVNNAGVGIMCEIKDMEMADWEWLLGVNYWGVVHCMMAFLPGMVERRSGHIVNVASANGLFAFPFGGAYASTKFAVVGLCEALRAEVSRFGVGVTAVCPGLTNTNILADGRIKAVSERSQSFMADFKEILASRGVDPMVVARAIPPAVLKNRAVVKAPFHVAAMDFLHRFAPPLYRAVIATVSRREN